MIDLELMTDNKKYTVALDAVDKIYKQYPNEDWVIDLKTLVATKSGNKAVMEEALEQVYAKNPEDPEIAEQYAYSIISKNSGFTFNETDKKAEDIINKVIDKSKERWFAYYCKSILDLKKLGFKDSLSALTTFSNLIANQSDLLPYYDDFYYIFALKYKNFLTNPEAITALESLKDSDNFAYNYLWGTYYWSIKDFQKGKDFLSKATEVNSSLSKPHFLLGSVYFEEAFLKDVKTNYPLAINEYSKALSIFEGDPYAWFSLGHVYKKTGRMEDALGAFQKTLYYMPAEDHNFDHFGVSIHAKMQVDEIKNALPK
jgi:tetratricopeptide (TPR) repeat protein